MRALILLLWILPVPAAAEPVEEAIACVARTVSPDTATRTYVWLMGDQMDNPPDLPEALAQATVDCGLGSLMQGMSDQERRQAVIDMLQAVAERGEGLTV